MAIIKRVLCNSEDKILNELGATLGGSGSDELYDRDLGVNLGYNRRIQWNSASFPWSSEIEGSGYLAIEVERDALTIDEGDQTASIQSGSNITADRSAASAQAVWTPIRMANSGSTEVLRLQMQSMQGQWVVGGTGTSTTSASWFSSDAEDHDVYEIKGKRFTKLVISWDSGTISYYIDGLLVGTGSKTVNAALLADFKIGAAVGDGHGFGPYFLRAIEFGDAAYDPIADYYGFTKGTVKLGLFGDSYLEAASQALSSVNTRSQNMGHRIKMLHTRLGVNVTLHEHGHSGHGWAVTSNELNSTDIANLHSDSPDVVIVAASLNDYSGKSTESAMVTDFGGTTDFNQYKEDVYEKLEQIATGSSVKGIIISTQFPHYQAASSLEGTSSQAETDLSSGNGELINNFWLNLENDENLSPQTRRKILATVDPWNFAGGTGPRDYPRDYTIGSQRNSDSTADIHPSLNGHQRWADMIMEKVPNLLTAIS